MSLSVEGGTVFLYYGGIMDYSVDAECKNCRHCYRITASKGISIPDRLICIYCGVSSLNKAKGKLSGYNAIIRWDGSKLEYTQPTSEQ
jgi:hypothetical protein